MQKVNSILDFAEGGTLARVKKELARCVENIKDPNTDLKPREINIKLVLTPADDRQFVDVKAQVTAKPRPFHPVRTAIRLDTEGNAVELTAHADGQADIFGEIHETKILGIFNSNQKEAQ